MTVVTRFAPSPTGALHIGGARTALFNWAFARHAGGAFHLRFEDTDRARSSAESEASMLEALRWLGLEFDPVPGEADGIPRQSARLARHAEAVQSLLDSGRAYRCVCTPEEVDAMRERARAAGRQPRYDGSCRERGIGPGSDRPFCVRLRLPEEGQTHWNDLIAGPSGQDLEMLDDFVLQRTDGTPIYHMAVVVDDHDMGVTHVIRAREHLTSTPRQLLLYAALGYPVPAFAHVPLLVDEQNKKLSKRAGDVSVQAYRDAGFTPQAVLNFIARLGWGRGDLEIFTAAELAELFELRDVGRSPSQVHPDKLLWINQQYIQRMPVEELYRHARPFLEEVAGRPVELESRLAQLLELLRARGRTLRELAERATFYLRDAIEYEPRAARKHLGPEQLPILRNLSEALTAVPDAAWTVATLEARLRERVEALGLSLGAAAQPLRVALVGSAASPGIFETLAVVGRKRALERLDAAIAHAAGAPTED